MRLSIAAFSFLLFTVNALAAEPALVDQPDLKSPLKAEWSVRHGTWEVKDGEMEVAELPENKHAAVLWHVISLQTGAVDCEFKFEGAKVFILGCDGDRHIGRVVITPKSLRIIDDSTEVKGKTPGTVLAEAKFDLKPGQWYALHYEWSGDRMAAKLGDHASLEARNPNLGKKKARWWFAVGGAKMRVRGIKVAGER